MIAAIKFWDVIAGALLGIGLIGIAVLIYGYVESVRARGQLRRMYEAEEAKRDAQTPRIDQIEHKTIGSDPEDYPTEKMPRRRNYLH